MWKVELLWWNNNGARKAKKMNPKRNVKGWDWNVHLTQLAAFKLTIIQTKREKQNKKQANKVHVDIAPWCCRCLVLNCHAQLATNKGKKTLRVDLDVNKNCMVILSYPLTLKISLPFSFLSSIHSYNFSFGNFMLEQLNRAILPCWKIFFVLITLPAGIVFPCPFL